jgi:hypothetical protein
MRQVPGSAGYKDASHEIQVPRKNAVGKLPTTAGWHPEPPWKHGRIQFLLDNAGEVSIISTPQ